MVLIPATPRPAPAPAAPPTLAPHLYGRSHDEAFGATTSPAESTGRHVAVRASAPRPLDRMSPAVYDVGFEFTDVSHADADRLRAVLDDSTAS